MNEQYEQQIKLVKRLHLWKMAFFGMVILIAGILIGSQLPPLISHYRNTGHRPGIEFVNERMIRHLQRELQLRPDQKEKIAQVYTRHLKAIDQIRDQARPKIAEQMNEFYADVSAVLDEEQQERWNESIERLRDRFMSRPGRPRDGRGPRRWRKRGRGDRFPEHRPFHFWQQQPPHEKGPDEHFPSEPPPPRPDGPPPPRRESPEKADEEH